ncbi:MAG: ComEC/Rec2 family competence protein, partial [Ruminococcus sp.]|nr:ComEC/Rec2 family competence protein [Candidatus Copronaster equi]
MKLKYRPMALIGFIVLLVFFICIYISTSAAVISIAIGCVLLIASLLIKQLRKSVFTFFISAALILSGTVFTFAPSYNAEKISKYDGKDCVITGSIDDEPNYENSRYYYTLKLRSIDDEKCNFKLRLSTHSKLDAEIFDTVSLRAKAYLLGDYNEDIMLYYRSHGVYLGAYTYNSGDIIVEKCEKPPLKYHFLKLRMQIENRIIEKLPNEYGGIVIGMLTGNKAFISDNVNEHIKNAGIAPLFAVSGLHFSIWVMSLYSLLDVLKANKRLNSIINIVFSLFFIALTGFSMSVCRAGLMLILLLVGNLFFRKSDSLNSLGFAVLILCLVNPMSAADYGFLLSVSATLGIIIIYPILNRHILENLKN